MNENILVKESIGKLFLKYSIPSILAMLITGSQTIIDGFFVGNFIGPNALASVNIVQPFIQVVLGFGFIISIGSLSILGRKLGQGHKEDAQNAFKTSIITLGIIGIALMFIGVAFHSKIAYILGASDLLYENVKQYLFYMSFFFPFVTLNILFGFACRLVGKPEKYLIGTIISLIANIVLDYVLIKILGFGMMGAAIATGTAYSISFFIVIVPLLDKKNDINLFSGTFDKNYVIPMMYNGSSEGVISVSSAITTFIFNTTFMGIAGESGVVAYTAICYLAHFGVMIVFGISDGIGTIISYNYGNKRFDRLKELMELSLKIQLALGVMLFSVLFFFGKPMVMMFSDMDSQVLNIAVTGSKLYAFAFLISGFNIIYSGFFTAIGDAKVSVIISLGRGLVFTILGINVLPMIFDINGIWLTVPVAELLAMMVSVYYIKRYKQREDMQSTGKLKEAVSV